jgi:Spy/CpxP family protein refolding chaperone
MIPILLQWPALVQLCRPYAAHALDFLKRSTPQRVLTATLLSRLRQSGARRSNGSTSTGGTMRVPTRVTRRVAAALALVGIALVPALAQTGGGGQGRPFGPPSGRGPFGPPLGGGLAFERLDRQLGLTDAQKGQIQTLVTEQRTALRPVIDSLRQAQQALEAAIMQVPEDDGLLQSQVTAVSTLQAQIELARAQMEAKIYQLLTPDQQQKAQQWFAEMQQRTGRSGL